MHAHAAPPHWALAPDALLARLDAGPDGLTQAEAAARLARVGPNLLTEHTERETLRLLARQLASPLVLILVFGAIVSLVLSDWVDAAIVIVIVVASSLLGFWQERRAASAVAALRQRLALTVRVQRDGRTQTVPAASIVPGDLVLLSAGNLVPADGVVIDARDFLVVESSLTGESFPVEKRPGVLPADTRQGARTNSVFLGTSVRSGTASVLVTGTGRDTVYGAIATRVEAGESETEFSRGVRRFGYLLLRVMVVMVLFVLTVNLLLHRPVVDSLMFAVALAVGLSPELLPAIVSVTLSNGARAMAARGVIVRRLEAIENLGAIDVFCTDKTGTLTEGVIELSQALDADGQPSKEVLRLAHLNAAFETGIENPLDEAVVAAGAREGLVTAGYAKVDEIPYDFIRRRLTIVVSQDADPSHHLIVTKGAFDNVLAVCTTVACAPCDARSGDAPSGDAPLHDASAHVPRSGDVTAGHAPLDDAQRARLQAWFRERGEQGFRVLAVATRRVAAATHFGHDDERGMCLQGFLLFVDPPKAGAGRAVRDLAALGIRTKVISGDNRHVSAHLARAIGLDPEGMLTGQQLANLRDEALWHLAAKTDLFVEVDPQQKERIVRALQHSGHVVGYLGDGINDAPALHAADVGISVDGAVEVARDSADIVLLRADLDVLRVGIEEGRRSFANTLKYISITTSANFGNMVSMALATPFLPFLPLAAKQILLNNFVSDLPSIAISTDAVDADATRRAQRWDVREVRAFMIVFGLVSTVFDLLTFALLRVVFDADAPTFQTAWFVASLLTELAVVLVLRTRLPAWRSRPSRLLLWTTIAAAAAALAMPFAGPLAGAFGFVPLPFAVLGAMVLVVVAYIAATEFAKRRFFAR